MKIHKNIILKAVSGDNEAFASIYESIYKEMYRYAYYMLGNEHDAEDSVAEAVVDIYGQLSGLKDYRAFRKWVYIILSAKCSQKRKEYINKHISIEQDEIDISEKSEDKDITFDLNDALMILDEEEKKIIILCIINGYKSREAAEILELNASTIRSKQKRALAKLKKKLEVYQP